MLKVHMTGTLKEGPWRNNAAYIDPWRQKVGLAPTPAVPDTNETAQGTASFPQSLDWERPSDLLETWTNKIQSTAQSPCFDSFQEYTCGKLPYGLGEEGSFAGSMVRYHNDSIGYSRLYNLLPQNTPGGEKFLQDLREYLRSEINGNWQYFVVGKYNEKRYWVVDGAGFLHFSEAERNYPSAFHLEFKEKGYLQEFLKLLKTENPRTVLELYLVSLLGRDAFPKDENVRRTSSYDRIQFYPFSQEHGSLEVHIADATANL